MTEEPEKDEDKPRKELSSAEAASWASKMALPNIPTGMLSGISSADLMGIKMNSLYSQLTADLLSPYRALANSAALALPRPPHNYISQIVGNIGASSSLMSQIVGTQGLASALVEVSKIHRSISDQVVVTPQLAGVLSQIGMRQGSLADLGESSAYSVISELIKMPSLVSTFSTFDPTYFTKLFTGTSGWPAALRPPNWRGVDPPDPELLETMVLEEGLPLGWVPHTSVLKRVLDTESPAARRKILGAAWKSISEHCLSELDDVDSEAQRYVPFLVESANLLLRGFNKGAQALATTVLDTAVGRLQVPGRAKKRTPRPALDGSPRVSALVLGGIWKTFEPFVPGKGHRVPQSYSRHASVHGVGERQYTRINALLALMHATSLVCLLDSVGDPTAT